MADLEDDVGGGGPSGHPSRLATRAAFAATVGLLALVLVVAARVEDVPEARTGRRLELVELIRAQQRRTQELDATAAALAAQVAAFEAQQSQGANRFRRIQRRIDRAAAPAGLTAVAGPGTRVVLTDSTLEASPTGNLNDLVIHEQDLQAVINALWAGGAEAMSVNGQRILATTAIRCVGNTLLLHGSVYSPPYDIQAVGDPVALRAELARDPAVARFSAAAAQFKLGFAVTDETLQIPSFEGATGLTTARVVGGQ